MKICPEYLEKPACQRGQKFVIGKAIYEKKMVCSKYESQLKEKVFSTLIGLVCFSKKEYFNKILRLLT